jgi:hypothetical protein
MTVALALTLCVACTSKSNTTEQQQPTSVGAPPVAMPQGSDTDPNRPSPTGTEVGKPMGSASPGPGAGPVPPLDAGVDAQPEKK